MYQNIHSFIHSFIHTYVHTYIHTDFTQHLGLLFLGRCGSLIVHTYIHIHIQFQSLPVEPSGGTLAGSIIGGVVAVAVVVAATVIVIVIAVLVANHHRVKLSIHQDASRLGTS